MMKMLHKGGIEVIADEHTTYESLKANRVLEGSEFLHDLKGAIKILYPILREIPQDLDCQIIWMERDFKEQAKSQKKIRKRGGLEIPVGFVGQRRNANKIFTKQIIGEIIKNEHFHLIRVSFEGLLRDPLEMAKRVDRFLGKDLDVDAMAKCVVKRSPKNFNGFMEDKNADYCKV